MKGKKRTSSQAQIRALNAKLDNTLKRLEDARKTLKAEQAYGKALKDAENLLLASLVLQLGAEETDGVRTLLLERPDKERVDRYEQRVTESDHAFILRLVPKEDAAHG